MIGRAMSRSVGLLQRRSFTRCMSTGSPATRARVSLRAGGQARHLRRTHRENPLFARPRHQRCRASPGVCIRRGGRSAGPRQLLGISALVVFRAACRVQLQVGAAGRARRISRHGQGTAPRPDEVILDVVYNHTAEGGADGPTICFRGLGNEAYYILTEDKSRYADYTGCGNTLNANEPIVRRLILDSLRYWVSEMHVDGFRFDLASILSRDQEGRPMASPPVLWDIECDPVLANVKLIAEAWDAAGLYQVGSFVGDSWKEWNGRFRDDVRAILKGDNGTARAMAFRLTGSPDIYEQEQREPEQSINFVACHDGFTLNDLVSFNSKHNEANGDELKAGFVPPAGRLARAAPCAARGAWGKSARADAQTPTGPRRSAGLPCPRWSTRNGACPSEGARCTAGCCS